MGIQSAMKPEKPPPPPKGPRGSVCRAAQTVRADKTAFQLNCSMLLLMRTSCSSTPWPSQRANANAWWEESPLLLFLSSQSASGVRSGEILVLSSSPLPPSVWLFRFGGEADGGTDVEAKAARQGK